jgi:hypothetical protein
MNPSFLPHVGITMKLDELKNLTSQFQESMDNIMKQANDSLAMLRESPGGKQRGGFWPAYLLAEKASHRSRRKSCLAAYWGLWLEN